MALKECNALTVTLTELDLSNTDSVMPVGDEGAGMVAEVQRECTVLARVYLLIATMRLALTEYPTLLQRRGDARGWFILI